MKTQPTQVKQNSIFNVRGSRCTVLLAAPLLLVAAGSGFTQPVIVSQPQDQAVALGTTVSFAVSATGTAPLIYQWRLEGLDLPGATNRILDLPSVQLTNGGGYTLLVTNLTGAATSRVAQLSVAQGWVYTNAAGARLPYRLFIPPHYDPATKYPLVLYWHGGYSAGTDNTNQLWDDGQFVFLSSTNQVRHPCFFLAPQLPGMDPTCEQAYAWCDQAAELLKVLQVEFSIDPDRLYMTGMSFGGGATWMLVVRYPDLFAAAVPMSARLICTNAHAGIRVPVWNFHAADDSVAPVSGSDAAVSSFRDAGVDMIYTRYQTGGHAMFREAYNTPALVDWVMAQNRAVRSTTEPLLSITSPTGETAFTTAAEFLDLAGSAEALGEIVTGVSWENIANHATGAALGTHSWSVTGIPLVVGRTNPIIVTATTTSWSAGYGGNTTFSSTLSVLRVCDRLVIDAQPTNQFVRLGSNVTFSVSACSPEPITYQWQWNGANIVDATNAALTVTNGQLTDEGVYTVVVSDAADSVTSAPANLSILINPVIVQPPLSQTVVEGGSVTLSAVISGNPPPFLFQWRRGMFTVLTNIVQNERTCFFTLSNVQLNQGGQYRLHITNAASPNWTAVSATFNLTVLADTDADRLPDVWETECGLNQASANHASADDDTDGLTNEQEYTAGTDPTNVLSYLKVDSITLAEGGSAVALGFLAVSNKTYTVQYRDSLDSGEWGRLADVVAVSSNRVVEISDLGAPTAVRRFYRLVTPRAP